MNFCTLLVHAVNMFFCVNSTHECVVPSQLPRVVTVTDHSLYHVLPLELAWWWLWRCGVQPGAWVLVLTNNARLVGALAVRAGIGLNLFWGVPEADIESAEELGPYLENLKSQVRVADGLPPVHWIHASPCIRCGGVAQSVWCHSSFTVWGTPLQCAPCATDMERMQKAVYEAVGSSIERGRESTGGTSLEKAKHAEATGSVP